VTDRDDALIRVLQLAREWRMYDRAHDKRADDLLQQLGAALDAIYVPLKCVGAKDPAEVGGERCGAEVVRAGPFGGLCVNCLELARKNYPESALKMLRDAHGLTNNPFE